MPPPNRTMDWTEAALGDLQWQGNDVNLCHTFQTILTQLSLDNGFGSNNVFNDKNMDKIFAEVSKSLASKNSLVRKMAGWVLLSIGNNRNFKNSQEVHLMAVNSLVACCQSHPDAAARGKALTVLCKLGEADMKKNAAEMNIKALKDSEYTRRLAVALLERSQEENVISQLVKMVETDTDPLVIVNALTFLHSLHSDDAGPREELITKETATSLITKLSMFSDLDRSVVLKILTNLTQAAKLIWTEEEVIKLLNLLDLYLDSGSPSVVLISLDFLLLVIRRMKSDPKVDASAPSVSSSPSSSSSSFVQESEAETLPSVEPVQVDSSQSIASPSDLEAQLLKRAIPTLLNAFRKNPEALHQIFDFLLKECGSQPDSTAMLLEEGIDWCFIHPRDPTFLVLKKIDMLVFLTTSEKANPTVNTALLNEVLSQLFMWTTGSNIWSIVEKSLMAVTKIRSISMQMLLQSSGSQPDSETVKESLAIFQRCLSHMLDLLDQPSPSIIAGALCALREALQDFDDNAVDVAKDATESLNGEDGALGENGGNGENGEGGALGTRPPASECYLNQLMDRLPACITVLRGATPASMENAVSALLFFIDEFSWASKRPKSSSPAYLLEDVFHNLLWNSKASSFASVSTELKLQFLASTMKSFVASPHEALPLVKIVHQHFSQEEDLLLRSQLNFHVSVVMSRLGDDVSRHDDDVSHGHDNDVSRHDHDVSHGHDTIAKDFFFA